MRGEIRYVWNLPIRGDGIADLSQATVNELYRNNIEFKNYFVRRRRLDLQTEPLLDNMEDKKNNFRKNQER